MRKARFIFFIITIILILPFIAKNCNVLKKTNAFYSGDELKTNESINLSETNGKEGEFRGVWVSSLVNDIPSFQNEEQYKKALDSVIVNMKNLNLNVLVFHVRMNNDAMYKSNLNPKSQYLASCNFDEFDPLEYIISKCHEEGIEFHAWMNPYRLTTSGVDDVTEFAKRYPSYNIASDPNMIVKSSDGAAILNPGEPRVRTFIIKSCLELMENYDVDAIHFDDYFYINGVLDSKTFNKYKSNYDPSITINDFRRYQVDDFIETLHKEMTKFNTKYHRTVQLGVAPTGVYRNDSNNQGNYLYDDKGTLISPNGSFTSGQAHYDAYLYCDTKKWIDNEWLDYFIPQTYWSIKDNKCSYEKLVEYWNAVCKYKKVNLYTGMGLYMTTDSSRFSWYTDEEEAYNQVIIARSYSNVEGHCIFSYRNLISFDAKLVKQRENLLRIWDKKAILPEYKNCDHIDASRPTNFNVIKGDEANYLSWDEDNNRKYVIYRSEKELTFSESEIYEITGLNYFVDKNIDGKEYNYGIKSMSITNSLSDGVINSFTNDKLYIFKDIDNNIISVSTNNSCDIFTELEGYTFTGYFFLEEDSFGNSIYKAKYEEILLTVVFKDSDGTIYDTVKVKYGSDAKCTVEPSKTGKEFFGWDKSLYHITTDLTVYAVFKDIMFDVIFMDDDEIVEIVKVKYGSSCNGPASVENKDNFKKWDKDLSSVTEDIVTCSVYFSQNTIMLTFKYDDLNLEDIKIDVGDNILMPQVPSDDVYDYFWSVDSTENLNSDTIITLIKLKKNVCVKYYDKEGNLYHEVIIPRGSDAPNIDAKEVKGYTFSSWGNLDNIENDTELYAIYEKNRGCTSLDIIESFMLASFVFLLVIFRKKKNS